MIIFILMIKSLESHGKLCSFFIKLIPRRMIRLLPILSLSRNRQSRNFNFSPRVNGNLIHCVVIMATSLTTNTLIEQMLIVKEESSVMDIVIKSKSDDSLKIAESFVFTILFYLCEIFF